MPNPSHHHQTHTIPLFLLLLLLLVLSRRREEPNCRRRHHLLLLLPILFSVFKLTFFFAVGEGQHVHIHCTLFLDSTGLKLEITRCRHRRHHRRHFLTLCRNGPTRKVLGYSKSHDFSNIFRLDLKFLVSFRFPSLLFRWP